MKIGVKTQASEQPICVNIDGLCNHADTYFEEEVQDNYNAIHEYEGSTPYTVETCNKCGSFRTVFEDDTTEWEGVQAMPL